MGRDGRVFYVDTTFQYESMILQNYKKKTLHQSIEIRGKKILCICTDVYIKYEGDDSVNMFE